jgi:predicted PurR-regulated permease PerM
MDTERAFGLLVLAVATVLTLALFRPFVTVVLTAGLLAYLLRPLYRRLAPRVGERVTAVGLLVASIVLVVVPFVVLLGVALSGLRTLLTRLRQGVDEGEIGVTEILESTFGTDFDVGASVREIVRERQVGELLGAVFELVGGVSETFIRLTILLFLSYYLLKNGDDLLAWLREQVPLPRGTTDTLLEQADALLFAVVVGNTVIAVADGLLVGVGLLLTGFSDVVFWTAVAVFLALIPLVGTTFIWVPAALYLVVVGDTVAGTLLFCYGVVIVGAVDNVLRPYVGATEVGLTAPLYIFGVFSGIALFGFVGIYFGPFVLVMTKILFDTLGGPVLRGEVTG